MKRSVIFKTLIFIFALLTCINQAWGEDTEFLQLQDFVWQQVFDQPYIHEQRGMLIDNRSLDDREWDVSAYHQEPETLLGTRRFIVSTLHRAVIYDQIVSELYKKTELLEAQYYYVSGHFSTQPSVSITAHVSRWVIADTKGGKPKEFVSFVPFARGSTADMDEKAYQLAQLGTKEEGNAPQEDIRSRCKCGSKEMPQQVADLLRTDIIDEEKGRYQECRGEAEERLYRSLASIGLTSFAVIFGCALITGGLGAKACVAVVVGLAATAVYFAIERYNNQKSQCNDRFCAAVFERSIEYYQSEFTTCAAQFGEEDERCQTHLRDAMELSMHACTQPGPGACLSRKHLALKG